MGKICTLARKLARLSLCNTIAPVGPHWRLSTNWEVYVALGLTRRIANQEVNFKKRCIILELPNELLDILFEYFTPESNALLRQTCTALRQYGRHHASIDDVSPYYLRSVRECLDRDALQRLILVEHAGIFEDKLFVC